MGDVDLRALQLQLQQQRSSLADQILARLPEASASANAPRVEETRRSSTLGLGAQGEQRAQSAADRKLRAKLSAKPRREHVEVREKEEEEEEDKAAMGRRMAKRKADPFAAAEAKVQAGKERAGQSWAPDLAHMSKAQRKKWNKRRRLEEESGAPVCAPAPDTAPPALTSLQSSMLSSLKGAHFRAINERLYTTDSRDAHAFMQQEPHMFDEYHEGFRQQVRKWPINPVDRIAELLLGKSKSKYTMRAAELSGALVVDIGAGEAALAKKLAAKRFHMLSYDLIDSADGWVCGLDAAKVNALPLPGTFYPLGLLFDETWPVPAPPCADLVVFCLSLMGTNWVEMIAEAWRVLRNDGELLLAEVTSRLGATGATDEFVALVESLGFALAWQDTSNTHFVLCSFVKRIDPNINVAHIQLNRHGLHATGAGAASSESTSESGNESQITSYSKLTTFVDGQPTTSTRMVISTASNGSLNDVNDNKTGFWHDSGAVGGTFAAVGIVTLALLIALAWLLWRRRKAKRMDADVVAAASAAAATSRTPFDDDDDDMMMSEVNGYAPDGALSPFGSNAVMPFYGRQAPEPGYPIQSHAASDDPYASDVPLAHQNALDYLTNANSRGTYVPVPNENGVPFDAPSSSGMFAAGLGAAAAAGVSSNGFEDPFRNSEDTGASHYGSAYGQPVGAAFSGHGSERNSIPMPYDERSFSAATQYNDAPESMHSNSQPRDAAIQQGYPLGAPAQPSYAADAPMQPADVGSSFQQAEPPFPMSTAQHDAGFQPMHAQALHPAAYAAANAKAAPAGFAAAQYDQLNEPPSYMFSAAHFPTNEKAAQDAKASAPPMADPSVSSALAAPADAPASLVQHSPELHPGAHLFSDHGDHGPADSQSLHGDWDPPALSSAWFPGAGQSVASGAEQSELTEAQARPFVTAHKFAEGDYPTASVVQSPQRLVVRNPSPEDV
ncbi:Rrp8p [Malassezia vespertilionis]|uniref:Ribosomal RNA-processing protein 8 n=1 Tax=Malassezia vespertilionis TaxID=2020962 RepID=A0A2N1JAV4_9BASI|nr:Rrp8p [Malassezia vespertilionis]